MLARAVTFHLHPEQSAVHKGFGIQGLSICSACNKRISFSSYPVFALENKVVYTTKEINFVRDKVMIFIIQKTMYSKVVSSLNISL